jgi:hypothetical protein
MFTKTMFVATALILGVSPVALAAGKPVHEKAVPQRPTLPRRLRPGRYAPHQIGVANIRIQDQGFQRSLGD